MEKNLNYEPAEFVPMTDMEEGNTNGGAAPVVIYGLIAVGVVATAMATVNYVINVNANVWTGSLTKASDYNPLSVPSINFNFDIGRMVKDAINDLKAMIKWW